MFERLPSVRRSQYCTFQSLLFSVLITRHSYLVYCTVQKSCFSWTPLYPLPSPQREAFPPPTLQGGAPLKFLGIYNFFLQNYHKIFNCKSNTFVNDTFIKYFHNVLLYKKAIDNLNLLKSEFMFQIPKRLQKQKLLGMQKKHKKKYFFQHIF